MKFALLFVFAAAALTQARDWPEVASGPSVAQKADPEYTREALDAKLEGTVLLHAMITENGFATEIKVVRGLGKGLDEKAVECLQKWRFRPRMRWGKPVSSHATVQIVFRLPLQRANV